MGGSQLETEAVTNIDGIDIGDWENDSLGKERK